MVLLDQREELAKLIRLGLATHGLDVDLLGESSKATFASAPSCKRLRSSAGFTEAR
jgi:hypothetical protein